MCVCRNAYSPQLLFSEAVVELGTWSGCSSDGEHAGFLELKQLKERHSDETPRLSSLPHRIKEQAVTVDTVILSTSLY